MNCNEKKENIAFASTDAHCPIGEVVGKKNVEEKKIPVLSCEGACIRGEIARQAAGIIAKKEGFARGCHGELFAVPDSAIAQWIKTSDKVVLIDGCFLRCHGRILEGLVPENRLIQFDALSHYNRYSDIFDYDDVPEQERLEVAQSVAEWVLDGLENGGAAQGVSSCCIQARPAQQSCCG